MPLIPLNPWEKFCEKWGKGCGAAQCSTARNVVLTRVSHSLPCDVVLLGEAPGKSEDSVGKAFIGPAGTLLDSITERVFPSSVKLAWCNLVGCIPLDEEGDKIAEPEADQIKRCRPRLEEFVRLAQPRLIVLVGKLAEKWCERGIKNSVKLPNGVETCAVMHPSAILRSPPVAQPMNIKRVEVILRDAWRRVNAKI